VSDILRPGQTHRIVRAQIIIDDGTGNAHAWEIIGGTATWDWTGVGPSGRSTANINFIGGEFRRRTKQIPQQQGEIE